MPVHLGRVKERQAEFDGPVNGGDGLAPVALLDGAVSKAHPHTAKSESRGFQIISKFALLHCFLPGAASGLFCHAAMAEESCEECPLCGANY